MLFIGSDPDLLKTSLCLMDIHGDIQHLVLLKIGNKKGETAQQKMIRMMTEVSSRAFTFPQGDYTVVCEGQQYTSGYGTQKKQAKPQDLIHLGQMSGHLCGCITSGVAASGGTVAKILIPYPQEWKGSVSKDKHHKHICRRMGLNYAVANNGVVVPLGSSGVHPLPVAVLGKTASDKVQKLNQSDWSDIMDSIGLAHWALQKHLYGEKIQKALNM